jgi:hypothetical protein
MTEQNVASIKIETVILLFNLKDKQFRNGQIEKR